MCEATFPWWSAEYVHCIGPSTNSCTSHGFASVGWQSPGCRCPASGPVLVSSPMPPREKAARAKYAGNRPIASVSSSGLWASTVCGVRISSRSQSS